MSVYLAELRAECHGQTWVLTQRWESHRAARADREQSWPPSGAASPGV